MKMTKAWDIVAYTIDGKMLHADCIDEYSPKFEQSEFNPVFASDETDADFCAVCDEGV
jgi:hypothetical protein